MVTLPDAVRRLRRIGPLRSIGTPLLRGWRRLSASGISKPIVINSYPKSGTHLVASVIGRVPRIHFSGFVITDETAGSSPNEVSGLRPADFDSRELARELSKVAAGTYANCHLSYNPEAEKILTADGLRAVFIARDPRDIVISQVKYIEEFPAHEFHEHLVTRFHTREERIMALATGWPPEPRVRGMLGLSQRMGYYRQWIGRLPTFRFEDFVAAPSRDAQMAALRALLSSVGLDKLADPEQVAAGIGDPWSATLSTGAAGSWRRVFGGSLASEFSAATGDLLQTFGYDDE